MRGLAEPAAEHARSSLALAGQIGGNIARSADSAFVDAMQFALLGGSAVTLAAAGVVLALHRKTRQRPLAR